MASVAGVVLTAIFIRQFVSREFDTYLTAQHRSNFIAAGQHLL